jgi:hypothetical protein
MCISISTPPPPLLLLLLLAWCLVWKYKIMLFDELFIHSFFHHDFSLARSLVFKPPVWQRAFEWIHKKGRERAESINRYSCGKSSVSAHFFRSLSFFFHRRAARSPHFAIKTRNRNVASMWELCTHIHTSQRHESAPRFNFDRRGNFAARSFASENCNFNWMTDARDAWPLD